MKKRYWIMLSLLGLAALFWGLHHLKCYNIYINQKYVAAAFSKEEAEAAFRSARMQLYENEGRFMSDMDTRISAGIFGTDAVEGNELTQRIYTELEQMSDASPEDGCRIKIGNYRATLPDEESAKWVIRQAVLHYVNLAEEKKEENRTSCRIEQIKIHDALSIEPVSASDEEITSPEEALRGIIDEMDRLKYGISFDRITTSEVYYEEEPVYQETETLFDGESEVYREGTFGVKEITASERFVNGVSAYRSVWSEAVRTEAVPAIIYIGTREMPEYGWPVEKASITSGFGERWGAVHKGIDIGVPMGTSVKAARGGTVLRAERIGTYGNCVIIDHGDGQETRYAHLSGILVNAGDEVVKGQEIARSGNSGRTTGPHLHFEIRVDGEPIDPMRLLD